jgi:hypothetical protein
MELESYFPFLFNYWPVLLAVTIPYCVFQIIMKMKDGDHKQESAKLDNGKPRKFLTPDQGNTSLLRNLDFQYIGLKIRSLTLGPHKKRTYTLS